MLWEPPGRSTMWRRGFNTPVNPNDNELNCGGYENQWIKFDGKCGLCGDPYQQKPRENEAGGKYATGTLTRRYKMGDVITLQADLTANHKGFMEYHLCPLNQSHAPLSFECFKKFPIPIVDTVNGKYQVGGRENGIITMYGKLPDGVLCSHCVIQWHYKAGNRWSCDENNICGKGRGPQEEFYGCADVEIVSNTDPEKSSNPTDKADTSSVDTNERRTDRLNRTVTEEVRSEDMYKTGANTDMYSSFSTKIQMDYSSRRDTQNSSDLFKESIPNILGDPMDAIGKSLEERYKTFRDNLGSTLINSGKKSAILDELSDVLWSLLKAVLQVSDKETGKHISLVKMSPVGSFGQISDIAQSLNKKNTLLKWPPIEPTIIEADIGLANSNSDQPIILSEVSALNDIKENSIRHKSDIPKESSDAKDIDVVRNLMCRGTKHHRYVKGISDWCTSNCRHGNCPNAICECKVVKSKINKKSEKIKNEVNRGQKTKKSMSLRDALDSIKDSNKRRNGTLDHEDLYFGTLENPFTEKQSGHRADTAPSVVYKSSNRGKGKERKSHVKQQISQNQQKSSNMAEKGHNQSHSLDQHNVYGRNLSGHNDINRFQGKASKKSTFINSRKLSLSSNNNDGKKGRGHLAKVFSPDLFVSSKKDNKITRERGLDSPVYLSKTQNKKDKSIKNDLSSERLMCEGIGEFARRNKMTNWCMENCTKGFCPKSLCKCRVNRSKSQ
ncbi:hypothetical protein FSP39_011917 [Pinctada imbricata]|uniref:Chitin-binding type-4 domain-containing protein n=1 Tax=Pinctada imbricata TaxID=66713 RepID=A0AA88YQT2_PINIB|nr:hypothetical protein FSP39_011917 [Pinctada imbricata]